MNHLSNKLSGRSSVELRLADIERKLTSCVHKLCSYHRLLGHLRQQTTTSGGRPSTTTTAAHHIHGTHVLPSRSRGFKAPAHLNSTLNALLLLLTLIFHLLIGSPDCRVDGVVVVGQISSTAANAASAAAALLVARGLEPAASGFGMQRYSLSFEPLASRKPSLAESEPLVGRVDAKTDKIGGLEPTEALANRRNFGDRLAGSLLQQTISKLTGRNQSALDNFPSTTSGSAKGKRDLITRMLKYRLARSNPLLSSWIRQGFNSSGNTTGASSTESQSIELVDGIQNSGIKSGFLVDSSDGPGRGSGIGSPRDVQLAVNASSTDYQIVKVADPSINGSLAVKELGWNYPQLTERISSSSDRGPESDSESEADADAEAADRSHEDKGFWRAQSGGQQQSRSQGGKGSTGARDKLKERGHLRHGWKNVFHREELKDKQRYRDVADAKEWPPIVDSNSTRTANRSRPSGSAHNDWGLDNESYGSKYDYVKGTDWRRQEPDELEPEEEESEVRWPVTSAKHGQHRYSAASSTAKSGHRNHGTINSASDLQHQYITSNGRKLADKQEPDHEETMSRIKRKLEKLESNMGLDGATVRRPLARRSRYNGTSSDSQLAVLDVDYDEAWRHPENSIAPSRAATNHQHSINEILVSAKGEPRNFSYTLPAASGGHLEPSMEDGQQPMDEEDGPADVESELSGQEEQSGKKNDQIRLKLELDLGKSIPVTGEQQVAAKNVLLKNISLPMGSGSAFIVHNFSQPLVATRLNPARHQMKLPPITSNNYVSSHKLPLIRAPIKLSPDVTEWPARFSGDHSSYGSTNMRHLNASMALGRATAQFQPTATKLIKNHRLPPGFAENQFAHLLLREQPTYDTEPFMKTFQRTAGSSRYEQDDWPSLSGAQQHRSFGGASLNNNDYRALDSGLSALTQILPNRPIFVKHLQMNGHLVAERPPEQSHPFNNTTTAATASKFKAQQQHPAEPRIPVRPPTQQQQHRHHRHHHKQQQQSLAAEMDELEEEPVFEGLNGSIGDTISGPSGAYFESSVEQPFYEQASRDYLLGESASMRNRVKAEPSFQELLNSPAEHEHEAFLYNQAADFYPSQSTISTYEHIPSSASYISPEGAGPPLDLSMVGDDPLAANHLLVPSSTGQQDRYPVAGGEPLLGFLEPAASGSRHPLVEVAHHALAHPLKSLNYASALLVNQQAGNPLAGLAGGLVLPAMQHTFGRLFKLPRALAPSLMGKHQLMQSQLNMNLARHLTVPMIQEEPVTASSSSRWRHLIAAPALHSLPLVTGPAAPLVELQDLMDASSSRLVPASIRPGFVVPPIKVRARLQHVPTKVDSKGHLVTVLEARPLKSAAATATTLKEPTKTRTPEARLKAWFSALSSTDSPSHPSPTQTTLRPHHNKPPDSTQTLAGLNGIGNGTGKPAGASTKHRLEAKKSLASQLHKQIAATSSSTLDNKKVTNQQQQQQGFTWFNIPYSAPANRHHNWTQNSKAITEAGGVLMSGASIHGATTSRPLSSTTKRPLASTTSSTTKEPHFGQRIISSFKSKLNIGG